jgi:hypothetical protein
VGILAESLSVTQVHRIALDLFATLSDFRLLVLRELVQTFRLVLKAFILLLPSLEFMPWQAIGLDVFGEHLL